MSAMSELDAIARAEVSVGPSIRDLPACPTCWLRFWTRVDVRRIYRCMACGYELSRVDALCRQLPGAEALQVAGD